MATVQQNHGGGQEPNAHSTPARGRNTRALMMVVAVMIIVAIVAAVVLARDPRTSMGGGISEERPAAGPANSAP